MNETVDAFINTHAGAFDESLSPRRASGVGAGEFTLQQMALFREYERLMEAELEEFSTREGFASLDGMYQALSKSISASDVPSTRHLNEEGDGGDGAAAAAVAGSDGAPSSRTATRSPWTVCREDDVDAGASEAEESESSESPSGSARLAKPGIRLEHGATWQSRKGLQQRARKNQKIKQVLAAFEFRYFVRMMRERALLSMGGEIL